MVLSPNCISDETNDPQAELDWLRTDIYGDDRHVTVLKAPATRRYSSRLWSD